MSKRWRSGSFHSLWTRPIHKHEYPQLVAAMVEDGLTCVLTESALGYQWYIHEYAVSGKSVRTVWGLTEHQYGKLMAWVYANDPFTKIEE